MAPRRRLFIDWARGVAVLCMIEHHAFDAWMPDSFHGSVPDRLFRFLGGVAAPTFLFLAGLAMVLMMEGALAKGASRGEAARTAAKRGLWILLGAHLFRLQQWAAWWGAAPLTNILRIDVLNCIAVALLATAGLWRLGATPRARALWFAGAGAAVVLATPPVWAADLSAWPWLVADYLHGQPPRALFPLLPWLGYAFAGALPGLWLAQARRAPDPARAEARTIGALALGAALLAAATLLVDALPFQVYAPADWWRTSPAYFLLRTCSEVGLLAACWAVERLFASFWAARSSPGPLVLLGRHSLLIYWVHIDLVYGRWMWRQRGTFSLPVAIALVAALVAIMVGLAYAAERFDAWREGRRAPALRGTAAVR